MLLTVKRLGSTNISLRRFARGRRGCRLSAGGWCEASIGEATLARRPQRSYDSDSARLLPAAALPQLARQGQISAADLGVAGEPSPTSDVDVERAVSTKAVLRQGRGGLLSELHGRLVVPIEGVSGRAAPRGVQHQDPRAAVVDEAVVADAQLRSEDGHAAARV